MNESHWAGRRRHIACDFTHQAELRSSAAGGLPARLVFALVVLAFSSPLLAQTSDKRGPVVLTPEALRIHRAGFVFDGHNDLPWELRDRADGDFTKFDISRPQPKLHTDIPRLRAGGVGAQFWSAFVPADTAKTGESLKQTLEQIDLIHRMIERYLDTFEFATTADDVVRIQKSGKIASLIGIEGGHSIQNSLGVLRQLHSRGARYMTLTHSETIDWADSATDTPRHGGLTAFGEDVVREMNRLGMLVDISHVSPETMRDAIRVSRAPVIASHSSAYAIAAHPRNVPDEELKLIAKNGGIVMVNFYSGFLVPEAAQTMARMFEVNRELRAKHPAEADFQKAKAQWRKEHPIARGSVHTVVDHIDHIVKVAGMDHVGLGSDYDGVTMLPEQLEDVSCYPYITQELLNRGYREEQIHKILSGNILRVMRAAEKVAEQ
jgi:membrane dipeptidase